MKTFVSIALLIAVSAASAILAFASTGSLSSFPTPDPGVVGVTAGPGALLVYGTRMPFLPRGFNSVGLLYPAQYARTMCSGLNGATQQKLADAHTAMTTETDQQLLAMKEHWRANTVRFQVSQGALTYEHESGLSAYTDMVMSVIHQARAMGMVTIVSMQTEGFSCTALRSAKKLQKLPDHLTEEAWAQLAPFLGHDRGVMLEVFNEPNTEKECGALNALNWTDWATGCGTGADEGMVTVAQFLRTVAPDNVLLLDGENNAGKFNGFTPSTGIPDNSAYVAHPYYYVDGVRNWNIRFGDLQTHGSTVVATEWNESGACQKDPNEVLSRQLVNAYLPAHNIGLIVHAWDAPGAAFVSPSGDPVDSSHKCATSNGATLAYDKFWSEAGGGQPAPEVHVSSVNMADGRVDAVTVVLANNGGKDGNPGPRVARSVNLLLVQTEHVSKPITLASMKLSTRSPWTHGSFTLATSSGLAQKRLTAKAGDSLIISVHYCGGGSREITYLVR
jgi:hypothetical protein